MGSQSRGRVAARLSLAAVGAAIALCAATGSAGAASLPNPLGSVVATPSGDPVGEVVTGLKGTASTLLGGGSAALPAPAVPTRTLPGGLPDLPAIPAAPVPPAGSGSADDGDSGVSAQAQAPAGDNVAAVDAVVASYLGVCARVPQSIVPVQADVVVLDRNLITELVDAGVPLQPLVVPCPTGATTPVTPGTTSPPAAQGTGADPSASGASGASAASALPTRLAFTGTDLAATVLLAGGLLAMGIAFHRKARLLRATS